jgi:hypothetical protein
MAESTDQDFPECSGNRYCCPENDGHGCCGNDLSIEQVILDLDDTEQKRAGVIKNYKSSVDDF